MTEPYLGEIRMFGGDYAPRGWALCDGQLLSISENDALFSLIGTTYGGDGTTTFAVPDLRGRLPVHQGQLSGGSNFVVGQRAGAERVTLNGQQLPSHTHQLHAASVAANEASPAGNVLARSNTVDAYSDGEPSLTLSAEAVTESGGSQSFDNVQPYLCISFIIALAGVYPSRT